MKAVLSWALWDWEWLNKPVEPVPKTYITWAEYLGQADLVDQLAEHQREWFLHSHQCQARLSKLQEPWQVQQQELLPEQVQLQAGLANVEQIILVSSVLNVVNLNPWLQVSGSVNVVPPTLASSVLNVARKNQLHQLAQSVVSSQKIQITFQNSVLNAEISFKEVV